MAEAPGGERDWDEAFADVLAGLAATTAVCRHGHHMIHKNPRGTWEDENGFEVCVKAPLADIGHGQIPDYVMHEPKPEIP